MLGFLAGCQANGGTPLPSPSATPEPLLPSRTATSTVIPSETPTLTPVLPVPSVSPVETPDPRQFVVAASDTDVWDDPANEGKYWSLQTELIFDEKVLVLEQKGGWSRIVAVEQPTSKDPLGYPGWVRTADLVRGWPVAAQYAVVMRPLVSLRDAPDGMAVLSVLLDTRLPVESTNGDWVGVRPPNGVTAWISMQDVRLTNDLSLPIPTDGLFTLAGTLAGIPYRWGGATPIAFDCSGFVYRLFHAYGITLARDARDQAVGGEPVARDELRKGDLIFTSDVSGGEITHVAMYWGDGMILDAAGDIGTSVRPLANLLAGNSWVTARRYLP